VVLALCAALAGCPGGQQGSPAPELAPPFELDRLGGGRIRLQDLRGKIVLLDFWATWCPPCELEVPELNAFYAAHRERGVELVAISIDEVEREEVRRWAEERGVRYPIAHGHAELAEEYGAFQFPFHVVIARDGRIATRLEPGYHDRDELAEAVTGPLGEEPDA
jgi:peroxiredoxin